MIALPLILFSGQMKRQRFLGQENAHPDSRNLDLPIFILSLAPIILAASKVGAGIGHFLPVFPLAFFLSIPALQTPALNSADKRSLMPRCLFSRMMTSTFISVGMFLFLSGMAKQLDCFYSIRRESLLMDTLVDEIRWVQSRYPKADVQMGVADGGESYNYTFIRPLLHFEGAPLVLDVAALMDIDLYEKDASSLLVKNLQACRPKVWILPKTNASPPFSKVNWYGHSGGSNGTHLFSKAFVHEFQRNYRRDLSTVHFETYVCIITPGSMLLNSSVPHDSPSK